MSKTKNIIEINGKKYDSRTGEPVGHAHALKKPTHKPARPHAVHPKPAPTGSTRLVHDVVRRPAKPAAPHQPQAAKTLMRQAVRKPAHGTKPHLKAQGHTGALVGQPVLPVVSRASLHEAELKRLKRATRIPRSNTIRRFQVIEATLPVAVPLPAAAPTPTTIRPSSPAAKHRKPRTTADLLQHALEHANSHEVTVYEAAPKRRSRRIVHFITFRR